MAEFVTMLIPIVVAALTMPLFDGFTRVVGFLDRMPAWAKQIAVAVLSFAITKVAVLLGVQLSVVDVTMLTSQDVAALASAGFTYIFKLGKTQKDIRANQP